MEELEKAFKHIEQAIKLIDRAEEKVHKKNPHSSTTGHLDKITIDLACLADNVKIWNYAISRGRTENLKEAEA